MRWFVLVVSVVFTGVAAADSQYRNPRSVSYTGDPITVYVSNGARGEVIFPETIKGSLPPTRSGVNAQEATSGLDWTYGPLSDRIFFVPSIDNYNAEMTVNSVSGKSYIIYFRANRSPDISLRIGVGYVEGAIEAATSSTPPRQGLIEYMMLDKTPPGYHVNKVTGPVKNRIVYKHGAVVMYLYKIYSSSRYTGLVLICENTGRTGVYFAVQAIDFNDPAIIRALGRVKEIEMKNPYLAPHPQFVTIGGQPSHQAYVYVVAKKDTANGRQ